MSYTTVSKVRFLWRKKVYFNLNRRLVRMIYWRFKRNMVRALNICAGKVLWRCILWKALHRWLRIYRACAVLLRGYKCGKFFLYNRWVCWYKIVLVSVIDICLSFSHKLIDSKCSVTRLKLLKPACPYILYFSYRCSLSILESGVASTFIFY